MASPYSTLHLYKPFEAQVGIICISTDKSIPEPMQKRAVVAFTLA